MPDTIPSSATELLAVSATLLSQKPADLLEVWQSGDELYITTITGQQFTFSADQIIGQFGQGVYDAIQNELGQVIAAATGAPAPAPRARRAKS